MSGTIARGHAVGDVEISGDYLGGGSSADVYRGNHQGQLVAVKVFRVHVFAKSARSWQVLSGSTDISCLYD